MSIQKLGLRYERLLILAAPISFACILVTFIAVASDAASDMKKADCYENAALVVYTNVNDLEAKWKQRVKIGKVEFANEYVSALSTYIIHGNASRCDYDIGRQDTNSAIAPADFAQKLKADARKI